MLGKISETSLNIPASCFYSHGPVVVIATRKVILDVFIWEILANMTQVSDVANGPLVFIDMSSDSIIPFYCNNIVYAAW
jgi:hypothetical protein